MTKIIMPHLLQRAFWSVYGRFAWDEVKLPQKERTMKYVVRALADYTGGTLLDAGCGTGEYSLALARAGFRVTAVDYAEGMLARARAKVTPADSVAFQQADLNQRLPFEDGAFDCVISMSVLFAVADPMFTLGEMRRVIKPGGACLLTHVPKNTRPMKETIQQRFKHLDSKNPLTAALVIYKVWRERTRATRYWTMEELIGMFLRSGFQIPAVDAGPPYIIHAVKPK